MSGKVNIVYIENLQHTPVNEVKDVRIMPFIKGLEMTYKEKTTEVMRWLLLHPDSQKSNTLKAFQERILNAVRQDGSINGADQIYIADLIKKVSAGILKLN